MIIDLIKKIPEYFGENRISDDVIQSFFDRLTHNESYADLRNEEAFRSFADDALGTFIDGLNDGDLTFENLRDHINGTSGSLRDLGKSLLTAAANFGIMMAATAAVRGAIYLFDQFNVTLEEQQDIVDTLTQKISNLQEEYDSLSTKKGRTAEEDS